MINNNQIFIIFSIIIIILWVVYDSNKETFKNSIMPLNYDYNKLTSNSIGHAVINKNKTKKLELILYKIVTMINKETNNNYFVGNIDNITINEVDDISKQFIVDLFLFDKKDNYTLKIIVDFTVIKKDKKSDNIIINTITRSNAMKYNYNYLDLNETLNTSTTLLDNINNPIIKGFNTITLPYSLYKGTKRGLTKKINPNDYYQEFIPLLVEQDINHLLEVEKMQRKAKQQCKNNKCWDCIANDSNNNNNNDDCNECKSLNNFEREKVHPVPKFNSSIMKNISDKKENSWLFEPTRVEIDHNF